MSKQDQQQTFLLTGSTGTIGKLLIQQLASVQSATIISLKLLVRDVEKARELFEQYQSTSFQIEYIQGDLLTSKTTSNTTSSEINNIDTNDLLFDKVEKIFILSPDLPQKSKLEKSLVDRALQFVKSSTSNCLLKQIVKLSALGVSRDRETNNLLRWHADSEYEILQSLNHYNDNHNASTNTNSSNISHVFIRPGMFMQNILGGYEYYNIMNGNLNIKPDLNVMAHNLYRTAYVDVRDLVKVISIILLERDPSIYGNKTFTITGPESLTNEEYTQVISKVLKRNIKYESVSEFTFMKMLKEMQVPHDYIWMLIKLFQTGKENGITNIAYEDYENITGNRPTTFEQFLNDHIQYFNIQQ